MEKHSSPPGVPKATSCSLLMGESVKNGPEEPPPAQQLLPLNAVHKVMEGVFSPKCSHLNPINAHINIFCTSAQGKRMYDYICEEIKKCKDKGLLSNVSVQPPNETKKLTKSEGCRGIKKHFKDPKKKMKWKHTRRGERVYLRFDDTVNPTSENMRRDHSSEYDRDYE